MRPADIFDALVGSVNDRSERPVLVAVDGPRASGKTTFADTLAAELRQDGRPVTRVLADQFLRSRALRYPRGADSPGYFNYLRESLDFDAIEQRVLLPLHEGDRCIVRAIYDIASDSQLDVSVEEVPPHGVVIMDGSFLFGRQLRPYWSLSILLQVSENERLHRAMTRDADLFGGAEGVRRRYAARYLPGYASYVDREDPKSAADIVIENSAVDDPQLVKWPAPARSPGRPRDRML